MKYLVLLIGWLFPLAIFAGDWKIYTEFDIGANYTLYEKSEEKVDNSTDWILIGLMKIEYGNFGSNIVLGQLENGTPNIEIAELFIDVTSNTYIKLGKIGLGFGLEPVILNKFVIPARFSITTPTIYRNIKETIATTEHGLSISHQFDNGISSTLAFYKLDDISKEEFTEIIVLSGEEEVVFSAISTVINPNNPLTPEGGFVDTVLNFIGERLGARYNENINPILLAAGVDLGETLTEKKSFIKVPKNQTYAFNITVPKNEFLFNYDIIAIKFENDFDTLYFQTFGIQYYNLEDWTFGGEIFYFSNSENDSFTKGISTHLIRHYENFEVFSSFGLMELEDQKKIEHNIGSVVKLDNFGYSNTSVRLTVSHFPNGELGYSEESTQVSLAIGYNF